LSLSRLDYIKGLPQLLEGVARLAADPTLKSRFKLRLVVVPSREHQPEYQKLREQLEQSVAALNASADNEGGPLVEFQYGFLSPDECIIAYRAADIFIASSISEGMNLVAKEYVAANPTGTLVLGRGAGAAERLSESILIDGTSPGSIASGLKTALLQPPPVELRRRLRTIVRTENVHTWAAGFLSSLEA
jgi:trehalose-6-phosphate synthase